ncbi:tetratricopeptide repeat protein 28-like [Salvelinus namaycush]|uniref:Tetratricopeptide repeat protein 28-like n=1 Tax=Salvelinus namaycush TaxID=8040 RepID=A0A8U0PKD6_SALNM|nr:tetratricopeptide repeat protein 28-like [Salvelinus namaycush]
MEKHRPKKERFSLFGPRSSTRATNPPSSSSSSSTSAHPIPPPLCQTDPHPCIPPGPPILSKAEFLEAVRRSNQACQRGQYSLAVQLYGEALSADPQNCILYSNRSAALLHLGQYQTALDDALKARLLNPKWPKPPFLRSPIRCTPVDFCVDGAVSQE